MYEKPSAWIKRNQEKESDIDSMPIVDDEHEPLAEGTRAEYRSLLKRMVERMMSDRRESEPSPQEDLGEAAP